MKKAVILTTFLALGVFLSQCKKESEEDLRGGGCNTENITYSKVSAILNANCNSCHSTSARFGNVILDNFEEVSKYVENGKLACSVEHGSGCSPMPLGSGQISQCSIDQINAWINDGAQNN